MPTGLALPNVDAWPSWARWNETIFRRYTIGVEEELMLVRVADHALAPCSDAVVARLSGKLARHASPETHAAALELRTAIHVDAATACAELAELRADLARELEAMGLCAVSAGTYPLADTGETATSSGARYQMVADTMGLLARREPTSALHVHVGVPDARGRGPRPQRSARRAAAADRAVGQLPVLPGPRQRLRLGPHRDLPGLSREPGRRGGLPTTADYVRGDRRADRLRRAARPELPVVGRAPAAGAGNGRGPGHGRPDRRSPTARR